jgi:uncharacterized protein (UPF0261 family)
MTIAVMGTFDTKGEEHLFIKKRIERLGFKTLTIHVGTKEPSPFSADMDLFLEIKENLGSRPESRDKAIQAILSCARKRILELYKKGQISGVISAGGGTGTYLGSNIMRVLPLGVPKVIVSTVASRNMAEVVGTKDITMMHSVVDILGINSISGVILYKAAGAVCGMVESQWKSQTKRKRISLTFFGFITQAAEQIKTALEAKRYEVIPFHANGTGGMAMEELAREGYFDGILDLATHELADELKGGYCSGIGPDRLKPISGKKLPRLVVPGGLDCAVLEFTRKTVPKAYRERKIFFYDFRSAVRLSLEETLTIADQMTDRMNMDPDVIKCLIPKKGWSEADRETGPLFDPYIQGAFVERIRKNMDPKIEILETDYHINDAQFAQMASDIMDEMVRSNMVASL